MITNNYFPWDNLVTTCNTFKYQTFHFTLARHVFDIWNKHERKLKRPSRIDNPETQATLGTRNRRDNQEWTIQRHRQHWVLDTEGTIKNGQSRDTGNIGH